MPEFKGHLRRSTLRIGGNVDFVRFLRVASAILGEIADNVINGSLLDTLVQKLKKLMMNISNKTVRLKKKSKSVTNLV